MTNFGNDPRQNLASTCQKKQSFKMGKYGLLQDIVPSDGALGGALIGVEKGLNTVAAVAKGTAAEINKFINGGVDLVAETVLGEGGANVGGANAVRGILGFANGQSANNVDAASANILELMNNNELSDTNVLQFTKPFTDAAEFLHNVVKNPGDNVGDTVKCSASPYAMDLIARGMKTKHIFVVDFEFNAPYDRSLGQLDFAYVVKQSERPTIAFDYDEINMYNYRTKVPTKTTYNPISMSFYDDEKGGALGFYSWYLKAMSPIANVNDPSEFYIDKQGMDFNNRSASDRIQGQPNALGAWSYANAASYGGIRSQDGTSTNIIKKMRLFHVYASGGLMDVYTFMNPKITEMQLDELNMSESGVGEVQMTFSYDSVLIENNMLAFPNTPSYYDNTYNLEEKTNKGNKYPIIHYGPPYTAHNKSAKTEYDRADGSNFGVEGGIEGLSGWIEDAKVKYAPAPPIFDSNTSSDANVISSPSDFGRV